MDVNPDIQLKVDNALKAANPALFCTKSGAPITFHLQVGKGEESLTKSLQKIVNSYGGRYVKRYHEMTPYTVLLVTDLGFKSEVFNRPAVCLTYIGDCVHTNSLMNLNEYLHPWENCDRWNTVNLFDVVYFHRKMFQCSSSNVVSAQYVPVSRVVKNEKFNTANQSGESLKQRRNSGSSELLEVTSEDEDLFVTIESNRRKCISIASTYLNSSSPVNVQTGVLLKIKSPHSKNCPITEDVSLETPSATAEKWLANVPRSSSVEKLNQQVTCRSKQCDGKKKITRKKSPQGCCTNSSLQDVGPSSESTIHRPPSACRKDAKPKNKLSTTKVTTESAFTEKTSAEQKLADKNSGYSNLSIVPEEVDGSAAVHSNNVDMNSLGKPPKNINLVSVEKNKNKGANSVADSLKPNVSPGGTKSLSAGPKSNTIASKFYTKQKRTEQAVGSSKRKILKSDSTQGPSQRDDTETFAGKPSRNSDPSIAQKRTGLQAVESSKRKIVTSGSTQGPSKRDDAETFAGRPSRNLDPSTVQKKTELQVLESSKRKILTSGSTQGPSQRCDTETFAGKPPRNLEPSTVQKRTGLQVVESSKRKILTSGSTQGPSHRDDAETFAGKPSGNLDPSTVEKRTGENIAAESSSEIFVSTQRVPSPPPKRIYTKGPGSLVSELSSKDTARRGSGSGQRYLQLQITLKNPRGDNRTQRRRRLMEVEQLSDGERSSISGVQNVPSEVPESLTSHQRGTNERISNHQSTSAGLSFPKEEDEEEPDWYRKRGRGYQDRYRHHEKVALLKWLVEHNKFKNLRGVIVWREIERKKVLPGRSYQSLKNQFLKHLLTTLNDYPFLTEEHKKKFLGQNVDSSDEDDDFFYHASSRNFPR